MTADRIPQFFLNFFKESTTFVNLYVIIAVVKRLKIMSIGYASTRTKVLAGTAAALLVALGGTGIYLLLSGNSEKELTLPDFTGQTKDKALAWADENNVSEDQFVFEYSFDETADADVIMGQSVPADTVLGDSIVTFQVSEGADPETMFILPDFAGQSRESVEAWFNEHKFSAVTYETKEDKTVSDGTFLSVNPTSGKTVRRKDTVIVTLAGGGGTGESTAGNTTPSNQGGVNSDGTITVPDFSTIAWSNATGWGTQNGVNVKVQWEATASYQPEQYIRQSVAAGSKVNKNDTIVVTYCSGKPVNLVSQIGKTKNDAQAYCTNNKLNPIFIEVYGNADAGVIVGMSPNAGIVPETAQITFQVSVGYVPVADYTGKTTDDAAAGIAATNAKYNSSANLKYEINYEYTGMNKGTILKQYINGVEQKGTTYCGTGSLISLTVSGGIQVPNMAGWSEEQLLNKLNDLGLKASKTEQYSDSVPMGTIMWNDTEGKNSMEAVAYTVSIGPENWDNWQPEETPAPTPESTPAPTENAGEGNG